MTESKSPVTENYSVLYSIHSDILFLVFGDDFHTGTILHTVLYEYE